MYGLVLMTALATGSATPAQGDGIGCFGGGCYSSGCCGGVVVTGGCYSSGCYSSGCYSSGCYGSCTGCRGSLFPLFPRARTVLSGFLGFRSCYGSTACYGSSTSYGSASYYSPSYGSSCFGTAPVYGCTGCTGCSGGGIIFGSAPHYGDAVTHLSIPAEPREYQAARTKPNAAPARLTIEVPEDAKLYVDGQLTKGEGNSRNFHTPDLPNGQSYFYDLKAEVIVDGRVVTETKKVIVRSGDALSESFPKLIAAVKSSKDAVLASQSR